MTQQDRALRDFYESERARDAASAPPFSEFPASAVEATEATEAMDAGMGLGSRRSPRAWPWAAVALLAAAALALVLLRGPGPDSAGPATDMEQASAAPSSTGTSTSGSAFDEACDAALAALDTGDFNDGFVAPTDALLDSLNSDFD